MINCELPPDTSRVRKGNEGWRLSTPGSLMKFARICACKWFTSIIGSWLAIANPLAKEVPTNNDPSNPGPRVKAMALISLTSIPAFLIACETTGIMFC